LLNYSVCSFIIYDIPAPGGFFCLRKNYSFGFLFGWMQPDGCKCGGTARNITALLLDNIVP